MSRHPDYVCPACKGPLVGQPDLYRCEPCDQRYPIIHGIPDFRLEGDPYIPIPDDRIKAHHLFAAAGARSFEALVRYYYSITPEDPPDLADRWTAHHLAEEEIARVVLHQAALIPTGTRDLLDLGCSTGALLVAAARMGWAAVGVDVALRWLIVGQKRLEEAGVAATLVCASARHLPFAEGTFSAVTANDLLEHVPDAGAVIAEARRIAARGSTSLFLANNRYFPGPEPHLRIWGVGYLPRRWQRGYVARRRADVHPYSVRIPSACELKRLSRAAGYESVRIDPAPLVAPHIRSGWLQRLLQAYNALRMRLLIRPWLLWLGPRLMVQARRSPTA
jgi:ubiquinone/menaquinone biosynthesis C-methylase UbiE